MNKAFTLVELAIVLVIIGLLIGGVLAGQELIRVSKLTKQIKDWEEVKRAALTYSLKYGRMAGDDNRATSYLTGVTNGDGDRGINTPTYNGDHYNSSDKCYFWQHLAAANLYTFSPPSCSSGVTVGSTVPQLMGEGDAYWWVTNDYGVNSSPVGTMTDERMICTGRIYQSQGETYLRQSASMTGNGKALRNEDAFYFDTKLDDGKPLTGRIRAVTGNVITICSQKYDVVTANGCKNASDEYDLTQTSPQCSLSIKAGF